VGVAVVLYFRLGDAEVRFRWMVGVGGQFVPELEGADVGRVLITRPMGEEGFVRNGQCELAPLIPNFPHAEGVLADRCLGLKAKILDIYVVAHCSGQNQRS
jgi:hypothetical protein